MKNILSTEQLLSGSVLSAEELCSITRLVYDTDPFIYPALCSFREAERIIPALISAGTDAMFCKKNLFVARLDGNIVGLILWNKGPLIWSEEAFKQACASQNICVSSTFDQVASGYLSTYNRPVADISIINVCVQDSLRGKGIGTALMHSFIAQHKTESMELTTLKDNAVAIDLYLKAGFVILREEDGFSVDTPKPRCYKMFRVAGE